MEDEKASLLQFNGTNPKLNPDGTRLRQLSSSEVRQRLPELLYTRLELEWTLQPSKKHSYDIDVSEFLTKIQDNASERLQLEEVDFIIRSFQDPPCLQFKAQPHSSNCSMCGQTRDFHNRDDGHQSLQNDTGLSSEATSHPPQASTSTATDAAAAVEATDTCHRPALTFGSVHIPRRFVGRPSSSTKEMYTSKYLKFCVNEDAACHLWHLMTNIWKLKVPSVVFSVTGGEIPDKCLEDMKTVAAAIKMITIQTGRPREVKIIIGGEIPDKRLEDMKTVAAAIKKITSQTECWFISDGLNYGTSKFLSEELQSKGPKDDQRNPDSPVFVCATHWGSIHHKELLFGISLPSEVNSSQYFYSVEHRLSQENSQVLNPYQEVYLLLDNGLTEAGNCTLIFRHNFEQFIKETAAKQKGSLEEVTPPIVTLVIGGDDQTLDQILYSVQHKNPVIIVNRSGDIPSLLSELFYILEDQHPSTWREEGRWMDEETFAFDSYIATRDDTNLRDVFKNMTLEKVQQKIRVIMKKRYYITVIDPSFENEDTLRCRILQGIYKGYSNRDGISIALKAGTYDFVEALFLRAADHRFTEGHYITTETLNWFHRKNLFSVETISKVLKFMCEEESIKVDPKISILPVIGRILHLLLGSRYRILYQKKYYAALPRNEDATTTDKKQSNERRRNDSPTTADAKEDIKFKNNEQQMWHLFLWSILSAKPDMTRFFLMQTSAPLGASLLAFNLYSRLAFYSSKVYEEELRVKLTSAADHFQESAIKTLENMYNTDADEAFRVLVSPLPFDLGLDVTPLLIADASQAKDFMIQPSCQAYLQKVWRGNITVETPVRNIIMTNCGCYPQKKLSAKPTDDDCKKTKPKCGTFSKVRIPKFCTAPVTKFYAWMFAYIGFLALLSYYVLTDLKPFTSIAEITVAEWVLIVWEGTLIVEEIAQLVALYVHAVTLKFSVDDVKSSNYYEMLRSHQYAIGRYLDNGAWNSVDLTMVSLFIVSFTLRFSLPLETFQMARIIFAVTIIVCYFRLLRYLSVLKKLGPRIIAIQMMLTELLKFLVVLALFVVSFGVAFQAILNPNQTPSWTTFADILHRPYWEMFGELFLDDEMAEMGRPVSDVSCQAMATRESLYANGTDIICYEWVQPVLLATYLFISSVLLLNLLIAIFSTTYDDVAGKSDKISKYNRYSLVQEFFHIVCLPPPLNILAHLYTFFAEMCNRKNHIVAEPDERNQIWAIPKSGTPMRGEDVQMIQLADMISDREGDDQCLICTAMPRKLGGGDEGCTIFSRATDEDGESVREEHCHRDIRERNVESGSRRSN